MIPGPPTWAAEGKTFSGVESLLSRLRVLICRTGPASHRRHVGSGEWPGAWNVAGDRCASRGPSALRAQPPERERKMEQAAEIANWGLFSKNELRFSVRLRHLQTWSLMSYSARRGAAEFHGTRLAGRGLCGGRAGGVAGRESASLGSCVIFPGTRLLEVTSPVHFLGRRDPAWPWEGAEKV